MKTNEKKRGWLTWLIGLGMASLMFALICAFGEMRYFNNDDAPIVRAFMGFDCAELPTFHVNIHPVLLFPLRWISLAFPGIAWYSWMQLAFLWFSSALSVKSIVGCFLKRGRSAWWGVLASTAYLVLFCMTNCCWVNFTCTAGLLGASAVLQILSIDTERYTNGQVVRSMLLALVPVVLAYGLRQVTAIPIVCFCGLAYLYILFTGFGLGKHAKRALKPMVVSLLVIAVVMGVLVGGREIEIRAKGMQDYLRWQIARSNVMDYEGLKDLPDELVQEIGWTQTEVDLVSEWYFLDSNITTEVFEKITAFQNSRDTRTVSDKLGDSVKLFLKLQKSDAVAWRAILTLGALALFCAVMLLMRRKQVLWQWLTLLVGLLAVFALLMYLGYHGRLPLRAAFMALLPFAALTFGLIPDCLPRELRGAPLALTLALTCAMAGLCVWYALPAMYEIRIVPDAELTDDEQQINPFADMDELAAENPDCLFIYDLTFAADTRLFPSTALGTTDNVVFWGGWGARSPENIQQLAAFDIDLNDMDATLFLREDVYLARGRIDNDPDNLTQRISELTGGEAYFQYEMDWGGVHAGRFYVDE